MNCPNCNGEMWDNTAPGAKKSAKSPDYVCKNKACIDPQSGRTTAIWLKKGEKIVESIPRTTKPAATKEEVPIQYKAMLFSYAKDLVNTRLSMAEQIENPTGEVIRVYKEFLANL